MFQETGNRALLRARITTVTPLAIRTGDTGLEPGGTDLKCVRTRRGGEEPTVYIPGSSLKGVVRSAAEANIRGQRFGEVQGACDPLDVTSSCSDRNRARRESTQVHREHCMACRLFGSLSMKGRAAIRDLLPWEGEDTSRDQTDRERANRTQVRFGVGINRISGGVSRGKLFDQEVVPAGVSFWGDIALENYQVWQLGLLASAFAELDDGFAQLGSSKSRGLGVVQVDVASLVHEQPLRAGTRPLGVGRILAAERVRAYGLLPEADLPETASRTNGLFRRFELDREQAKAWLEAGKAALGAL
ncbi:MAG: CRISPR-associated RAMP protein Csx7 [Minicystis sp.]